MGIVEQKNQRLGIDSRKKVSTGLVVKAMLLNGLGFVSAPSSRIPLRLASARGVARLYLFEQFFQGKATEQLLGFGIKPEYLNDDRLGDVLDELYDAGLSEVFLEISLQAARRFGVKQEIAHLDSTSFHLDGKYKVTAQNSEPGMIEITYGYRERSSSRSQTVCDEFDLCWRWRHPSNDGNRLWKPVGQSKICWVAG